MSKSVHIAATRHRLKMMPVGQCAAMVTSLWASVVFPSVSLACQGAVVVRGVA